MKKYIISLIFIIIVANLSAQVLTQKVNSRTIDKSIKLAEKSGIDVVTMPAFDVSKLLAEDELNKASYLPYRFGYAFEVNYNMQNSGTWSYAENGRVWSLKIVSKGAYSINLAYDKFYLPEHSQLYIYNENKTVLQGPITSKNNTKDGTFSSDLIEGSAIILEYFEPDNVKEKAEISISKVVHAYRNLFSNSTKGFGSSGDCNVDINCPEGSDWQNESNAVAMILIGDTRWCSGCMVNNTAQDFTPYFLTANHCIQGQNVTNWSFRFQYKSPTCGGGDDYSYYSYYGADLEANSSVTDFALLELDNRPTENTGITYAGWSRSATAANSAVGIHHPSGDVMKISFDNNNLITNTTSVVQNLFAPQTAWRTIWDIGTTEGGSSGSPLFDPNHQIIGQLGGGGASCDNQSYPDYYGRFDVSWNNGLSEFLDPGNTGAMTTNTILIPQIIGPSTVCSSNSTFTIQNRPPNSTITWSKSSNLTYVSGQGTNNYTVRANGYGNGWVQANINGAIFRKEFSVGKPLPPYINNGTTTNTSSTVDYNLTYGSPTTSLQLSYVDQPESAITSNYINQIISGSDNFELVENETSVIINPTDVGTGSFIVKSENQCGISSSYTTVNLTITSSSNTGGHGGLIDLPGLPTKFTISPNPASDYLTVTIESDETKNANKQSSISGKKYIVQLWNTSRIIKEVQSSDQSIDIPINNLTTGTYYIRVIINGQASSRIFLKL